jgi:hypothetical protein
MGSSCGTQIKTRPFLRQNSIMTPELIEDIYNTFSKYKLNDKITGCYCAVCLTEEFNQHIHTIPLKSIQTDDLRFYISAVGITDDDCNDFKYFLPRILELIYKDINLNEPDNFYLFIWRVLAGIDYSSWKAKEVELFITFFNHYWDQTKEADDEELGELTIDQVKSTILRNLVF